VDLDDDGQRDILSGPYSRMEQSMAGLFQFLKGQSGGTFQKAEVLNGTDGKPLIIPVEGENWIENICTRPFAIDWDGDKNLDLVVGNFAGKFYLFKGKGKGQFLPEPQQLKVDNEPLKIDGHHSDPFVIDWDGDGDLDLLSGSSEGGVQWAENRVGPGKAPQLQPFRSLIQHDPQVEYGQILHEEDLKGPGGSTRIWVDDINSDGKLDLLVGDLTTLISPADKVSEAEFKQKFADWQKAVAETSKQLNSTTEDENQQKEAHERFQKLYSERSKFMKEDRTGFVWLYLQK
jgi:FG-GAP-like repeat